MKPNVLIIAGHDPSGGAGIHADIEAVQANGGFASTLITGLTIQNSQNVRGFEMVSVDLLRRQAECLLEDLQYSAVSSVCACWAFCSPAASAKRWCTSGAIS